MGDVLDEVEAVEGEAGAAKVTSYGQPVLVPDSMGTTIPNGVPPIVVPNPKNPTAL